MFYKMIENKCTQWYESERCTVKNLIEYIEKTGQMRDAQIEAIKVYLFLKIACECKPLTQLFRQGFFNSIDLNEIELSKSTREYLFQNPAAATLFEYACLTNDKGEQVSEKLEKQIKKDPTGIDYNEFFRNAFYGVSYTDYLFSLPMGAGKTYLMAAFIYLDLYFAYNEPTNPSFAHNFIIFAPSGFSSTQRDIHFFSDDKSNEDYYIPRILRVEQLKKLPRERSNKYFPDLSLSTDVAIYNAIKLCHNGGVAIYLGQQRSMKTVFERIINLDKRNYDLKALKDNTNQAELSKIKGFIESYYGSEHYYTKAAELGVLPHSSNLQNGVKLVVEHALKNKYVSCVVCTSTLAQGVNIPIKYLLVTSIRNGLKLVKARDFQNLMGRTARAGIYTEGSIIITDCKIYDNRTNWKNGGRYLWNDCVKLFDTKLTEPCGSSILSLVQDFNIDYDVTVSGEKFIDIVIDHLDERDFLLDYAKKLEKAYLKVNPKRTQNLIVQEILLRQDIISNIENYLCLVRSAETLVNDSKKSAVDICTNTLAYAMATEKEKELLIKVFQKIEENIQQYSVEKLSRYSNAMSGIGLSSLIEEWIVQNELTEKIYTETELLYVITELYLQICGDFRYQEHIQSICKKWIDGQTPMEINNKETIGIAEVESLCNKRISYEMNFLIGNICDLIEVDGENEEQVDQRNILTLLQKKVKYGVPNMTAISICESVFNDRLLAIELAQILSDANIGTDKILNMLKAHSEEIFSCLDSYPEYFKDRLSVLMK